jgi:CRISPR-associated protein Csx3
MKENEIENKELKTYNVVLEGDVLKLSFGTPAQNDQIVKDAVEAVKDIGLEGGKIIKLNGPASLPVAIALSHQVGHLYGVIAAFDPKLGKYVVAISHDPELKIGDLID